MIGPGDKVTIRDRFGVERTGKAVMLGPCGWVLNMGGRHGTPAVATPETIVKVRKAKVAGSWRLSGAAAMARTEAA